MAIPREGRACAVRASFPPAGHRFPLLPFSFPRLSLDDKSDDVHPAGLVAAVQAVLLSRSMASTCARRNRMPRPRQACGRLQRSTSGVTRRLRRSGNMGRKSEVWRRSMSVQSACSRPGEPANGVPNRTNFHICRTRCIDTAYGAMVCRLSHRNRCQCDRLPPRPQNRVPMWHAPWSVGCLAGNRPSVLWTTGSGIFMIVVR